jgi:hypothetical protein
MAKDDLAQGKASATYGNSDIKTSQTEWERIFGPATGPVRPKRKSRKAIKKDYETATTE